MKVYKWDKYKVNMDNSDYDNNILSVFFSRLCDKILIWMLISFDMDKYDYYSFFFFC